MEFYHEQDLSSLWKDFSSLTPFEDRVSEMSLNLKKVNYDCLKETHVFNIDVNKFKYKVYYYPKVSNHHPHPFISDSIYDDLYQLFGINESFFIIFMENLEKSDLCELTSIMACAFNSSNVKLPFFVKTFDYIYGMKISRNCRFIYNTIHDYNDLEEFKNLSSILDFVQKKMKCTNILYSARIIYQVISEHPFIVCNEWENEEKLRVLKFEDAPKCSFITFDNENDYIDEYLNQVIEKMMKCQDDNFDYDEMSDKIDFSYFSGNESVLKKLSYDITNDNFHILWYSFIQWLRYCYNNHILINNDDKTTIDYKSPIIYQKIQLLNFSIEKIKNGLQTSYYMLTSDQIDDINEIIKKNISIDNMNDIIEIRDKVIQYKSKCVSKKKIPQLNDILKYPHNMPDENIKIIFNSVSDNLFDPVQQCELIIDYISTLTPHEYLMELFFFLISDKINEIRDKSKIQISFISKKIEKIQNNINLIQGQLSTLKYNEILSKFKGICSKINKIQYNINLVNYYFENHFNSKLIESILKTSHNVFTDALTKEEIQNILLYMSEKYNCVQQTQVTIHCNDSNVKYRIYVSYYKDSNLTIGTVTEENQT